MTFELKNLIDFSYSNYSKKTIRNSSFFEEIKETIPSYLESFTDEIKIHKKKKYLVIHTTLYALNILLKDCGNQFPVTPKNHIKNKIYRVEIYAETGDDYDFNSIAINFDVGDNGYSFTFNLSNTNLLVGSLYYFINFY